MIVWGEVGFLRRLQGPMVWEFGNVLGGGGKAFLNLWGMRKEMDLRCGFGMIMVWGAAFKVFFSEII